MLWLTLKHHYVPTIFRAKAQTRQEFKFESKMESWLWWFMWKSKSSKQGFIGHNFHWYTLHKTYTSDQKPLDTTSCARTQNTNSHFLQKISNLKTQLEVDSKHNFHPNSFLRDYWTHPNQNHPLKRQESVPRTQTASRKLHNRILILKYNHYILFMESCSLWSSETNHYA